MQTELKYAGVVGLGLMGCSIVAALAMQGYNVIAVAPMYTDMEQGPGRVRDILQTSFTQGIHHIPADVLQSRIFFSRDYASLSECFLVCECVIENVEIKKNVFQRIEDVVGEDTIVTTNTSAIPIGMLQEGMKHPGRFMGMHWAEPAFTTPFLEIICGPQTDQQMAASLYDIATSWGKEPTLLKKDIRGFIANRIMYAMYREAFFLVENGYASVEDVDRACKHDAGHWMTFCGLFRFMDLTGLQAYYHVIKDLFPTLSNQTTTPLLIERIAKEGGNGTSNAKGFYSYTPEEAKEWEKAFEEFSYDINKLAQRYPGDLVQQRLQIRSEK
jgi:3-hydroxybutyryl-CoA dehydrogenase